MKKLLFLIVPLLLCGFTCNTTPQSSARDTAAALKGAITAAQTQYQTQCSANPNSSPACSLILKAVSAQNALITATEAYCGWSTTSPPTDPNATCVPVSSAQAGLQTAIANATSFISQLKGVIQ
jgi:hypothetical protein